MNPAPVRIAIVQHAPVHLDLAASISKAEQLIDEAANGGATLIVFGETWLSGYPAWLDIGRDVAVWDHGPMKELFRKFRDNSIVIPGDEIERIRKKSEEHSVVIGIGVNERTDDGPGSGTVYNSFLLFESGTLKIHHRKLMPTFSEKLVYGTGDGKGLEAVDTIVGRVGGLICWEHWMPMARQTMHDSGEQIHLALWPRVKQKNLLSCQHYAIEGRCFVVATGQMMPNKDLPQDLEYVVDTSNGGWALDGGSTVIGPDGELLEPQNFDEGILYYDIEDVGVVSNERMTLDTSGHYQRRDIFRYKVDRERPE